MRFQQKKYLFVVSLFMLLLSACHKDLDKLPPNTQTSQDIYSTEAGYLSVLAKVYGGMALTGNAGPAGAGDVAGIDEGTSDFLRLFWKAQELSTDEAVVAWNDPGIQDFHNMNWSSSNPMLKGLYYRCIYVITLSNEFIRQTQSQRLEERGITGETATRVLQMQAEARFVRAFQYWVLLDLFANPTFITEADNIGAFLPKQIQRHELFRYINNELTAVEAILPPAKQAQYGRVDKASVWALKARLWLNAVTYIPRTQWANWSQEDGTLDEIKIYNKAVTYAENVINGGYSLEEDYRQLMLADNFQNRNEFIWTLNYDGIRTKNFGGTTFLVNASVGGDMEKNVSGLSSWGGIRTTKNLPLLFPDFVGDLDRRAQFVEGSQTLEIDNVSEFKNGLGVIKYRNKTRAGEFGSDPERTFSDIDFPVFRLAEMFLIYAEGVARKATSGNVDKALSYVNELRKRAYGNSNGNVGQEDVLDLDFLLKERARELYWEGHRRTDLIRHNKFTEGTYNWPWKGGVKEGTGVPSFRRIYPIPDSEIASNPNIKQNEGY